jgi:hypothetical protein
MPDVTQAEVGRRLYHVHREKTVERAMKLMQHGIGAEWKSLSEADINLLSHLLQCTWNIIDQGIWDKIPFSGVTMGDLQQILSYGEEVRPGRNPTQESIDKIKKILLGLS